VDRRAEGEKEGTGKAFERWLMFIHSQPHYIVQLSGLQECLLAQLSPNLGDRNGLQNGTLPRLVSLVAKRVMQRKIVPQPAGG
jgi:hypothetical protein